LPGGDMPVEDAPNWPVYVRYECNRNIHPAYVFRVARKTSYETAPVPHESDRTHGYVAQTLYNLGIASILQRAFPDGLEMPLAFALG